MLAAVFHDTALVDQCCNLTPVTSVTTFKNWWQLGFHPKFAIDTLCFYRVDYGCIVGYMDPHVVLTYRCWTLYRTRNVGKCPT